MQEKQSTINQDSSLWIGLDSYKESNSDIFFGRDEEIRQLSGDIFNNIQTVIYGPSGTGKTSIIQAGIFKIARANRYLPVYVRLNHNTGSKTYTQQIIDAVQDEAKKYNIDIVNENIPPYIEENVCLSLWEYFHCNEFWNDENYPVIPLIVIDQFEEIFTLGKNLSLQPDFFIQLSDLCDNKYPQYIIDYLNDRKNERIEYPETINYRFVISLREDFLARLEEQAETIPALKRNRFSLQCINEEQALDIILKPQPGLVSEDVAGLIIEKITNKKYKEDFKFHDEPEILVEPAILSLFCRELDKKRREKAMPTLSSNLIGEFGDDIIRDFYISSLSSLSEGNKENDSPLPTQDEKIDYLESQLVTVDGFRDAVAYQNAKAFGFTKNDIKTLIDNRLVRIDEWDGTRRIEFIHDVICKVANKHRKKREQERENKRKEEEAKKLLQEEKAKREKIEQEAEEEQRKLKAEAKRIRRRLVAIGITTVFFGLLVLGWWYLWVKEYHEDYGNYTTLYGWPVGLGEEIYGKEKREQLIVCYRLSREGRLSSEWNKDWPEWLKWKWLQGKPFVRVDVITSHKVFTTNKFYEAPIVRLLEKELDDEKAANFAELQQKTSCWIYSPGDADFKEVARCTAYNLENKELYSIQYYKDKTFASKDENKYVQWAVFNDVNGKQMMVTDNGADRMRQTVKNGLVTGCLFFTELGTPQKNAYNAYGYQYEVDSISRQIQKQYCVDKFGNKIDSTLIEYFNYKQGRVQKTSLFDVIYPQQGMIVYQFKNFNDTLLFNKNGTLGYGRFHTMGGKYSEIIFKYDEENRSLLNMKYSNALLVESKSYEYQSGRVSKIDILEDGITYTELYSYPDSFTTDVAFWEGNNKFTKKCTNEFMVDTLYYHKKRTTTTKDSLYDVETTEYLDTSDNPISSYDGYYAKYSKHRDATKNIRLEYFYDSDGEIFKSEWFDYDEYGNRIARAVAGIDGKPVRCPKWDWNSLCYYKMSFLKNFSDEVFVAVKGTDEFGEESYIIDTNQGSALFEISEMPLKIMLKNKEEVIEQYTGLFIAQGNWKFNYNLKEIPYLHILNKKGSIYNSTNASNPSIKILDGDILYKVGSWDLDSKTSSLEKEWNHLAQDGGDINVLKLNGYSYELQTYHIQRGTLGAEYHYMPITQSMVERIRKIKK